MLSLAFLVCALGAQNLPEGKGRAQFQRICGMCHGVQIATKPRLTADQWSAIVDDMVSRGAQGTDDDFELVVKYLAANFGPGKEGGGSKDTAAQKVEINRAGGRELADRLGLSGAEADAILAYRTQNGPFKDWDDIRKLSGVDLKKLESQKDRIVFSSAAPAGGDKK